MSIESESQVKLFLSVDIAGSTKLKNINNYFKIQEFCEKTRDICRTLNGTTNITEKDIYSQIRKDAEYQDWSEIIRECFTDFHTSFMEKLSKDIFPWKMAGDELIYCIDVKSRLDVYNNLLSFYLTLKMHDKIYKEKGNYIRLKGSAWTAGFPIRNRIMSLITSKDTNQDLTNNYDYMGQEIDIGFRLGKFTTPGIIVVSLELASILLDERLKLQDEKPRFTVIDTGWEILKGVWNNKCYPIYWIKLPDDKKNEEINYEPYTMWEKEENNHIKNYCNNENSPIKFDNISRLIASLPKEFDVELPYFVDANEPIPEEHKKRIEFIQIVLDLNNRKKLQELDNDSEKLLIAKKEIDKRFTDIKKAISK